MEEKTKMNSESTSGHGSVGAKLVRLSLPFGILVVALVVYGILAREPEEKKRPKAPPRAIKTRVAELEVQDYPTFIQTQGRVRAHNEVTLTAQVSGRIVRIMPEFEDGAFFDAGDVLAELEEDDFKTAVTVAEAA